MKQLNYTQMKQVESQDGYQATPIGKAFLNMTRITELYDKLENMERGTEAYEAIQIEIDQIKNLEEQEPMVAYYIPRENGKTGDTNPF